MILRGPFFHGHTVDRTRCVSSSVAGRLSTVAELYMYSCMMHTNDSVIFGGSIIYKLYFTKDDSKLSTRSDTKTRLKQFYK